MDKLKRTFYGFYTDDWSFNHGSLSSHHYLLDTDYPHADISYTASSTATSTIRFMYPHYIADTYYLEGIQKGHITYTSTATSTCTSYVADIIKIHSDSTETTLATTGTITVADSITTSSYVKYPFWIYVSGQKITKNERLGLKVTTTCENNVYLSYDTDSTNQDIKIEFSFLGL